MYDRGEFEGYSSGQTVSLPNFTEISLILFCDQRNSHKTMSITFIVGTNEIEEKGEIPLNV